MMRPMPTSLAVRVRLVVAVACVGLLAGCASKAASERTTGSEPGQVCFGNGTSQSNPCLVPTTVVVAKPLPSGTVASALDVAAAIKAAGIGCEEASLDSAGMPDDPNNPTKEQASCEIGDDSIAFSLFADGDSLEKASPMVHAISCTAAAHQATNLTYVEGSNWIVYPEHKATAERVAQAIGTLRTITC